MHATTGHWQRGFVLASITALCWGVLPIALKYLLAGMDGFTVIWYRLTSAAIALGIFLAWRRNLPKLPRATNRTLGLLVVKPPSAPFVCGSCSVVLPGAAFAVPLSGGAASQPLPIPCDSGLVGAQIDTQWAVLGTSTIPCPLFGNVSASARLRLTIGQ